jgi:dTDP-4-amino-4,6-dideoxygalactose transaminase
MRMIGMSQNSNINYKDKRDWNYDVFQLGYRYHMPNLHAAIGISQLLKLPQIKKKRREIYSIYYERLNKYKEIKLQGKLDEETIPFICCIRLLNFKRQDFRDFLKQYEIETGIHWRPGHRFAYYSNSKKGDLSNTEIIENQIVSLPFFPSLSIEEVNFICDKISLYIESHSK